MGVILTSYKSWDDPPTRNPLFQPLRSILQDLISGGPDVPVTLWQAATRCIGFHVTTVELTQQWLNRRRFLRESIGGKRGKTAFFSRLASRERVHIPPVGKIGISSLKVPLV